MSRTSCKAYWKDQSVCCDQGIVNNNNDDDDNNNDGGDDEPVDYCTTVSVFRLKKR